MLNAFGHEAQPFGFGSNFSGPALCLPHQLGGIMFMSEWFHLACPTASYRFPSHLVVLWVSYEEIVFAARRSGSFYSSFCHRIRVGRAETLLELAK